MVATMKSQELGKSSLIVSKIGLGLAALGRPGYINLGHASDLHQDYDVAAMEAHCHAVLDAAWSHGVRYFDGARSYGRAEVFLADWLKARNIGPEEVTICSKWGYTYTADWKVNAEHHEIKDHSVAHLKKQFAESREIFGNYLDLYQIHSATLESGVLDDRSVLEELTQIRMAGPRIGLTLSGPKQAAAVYKALQIEFAGQRLFDAVQATWNLLEPSAGPALKSAHAEGMGVILKEVLANGRLTPRNDDPSFAPKRQILEKEAHRHQTTLDALALAAGLAKPWVDVVLSGAASVSQLESNLAAIEVNWDEDAALHLTSLAEPADEYWQCRSKLSWN